MFSVVITLLALRHTALYRTPVKSRMDSPAHRGRFTVDVLEYLTVESHYTRGRSTEPISSSMHLRQFLDHVSATAESFFVVTNKDGKFVGTVSLDHVRSVVADTDALDFLVVSDAMTPFFYVTPDASLGDALKKIVENGHEYAPVLASDDSHELLGLISQRKIAAEYSAEILRQRLGGTGKGQAAA
jgi:CIC family chloride channel protein